MPSIYAIITARGGSKGIPRKNLRILVGKPLIAYSILAAMQCAAIDRCMVSTEDEEIKQVSLTWGAEVIDRPAILAGDTSLSRDVVRHALKTLAEKKQMPDYFVLLQPTSPLRNAQHITECVQLLLASTAAGCVISVIEAEHHPYKTCLFMDDQLKPVRDFTSMEAPRQILPKAYRPNGAIYIMKSETFLANQAFFVPPCLPYVMNAEESIDIDNEADLALAASKMQANLQKVW